MQSKYLFILPVVFALIFPGSEARAERAELIDRIRAWSVHIHEFNGKTVCFVASRPRKIQPKSLDREYIRAYISTWKGGVQATTAGDKARSLEVSILVGSTLKSGDSATVQIDGHSFALFGEGLTAYVANRAKEKSLVKAMQKGKVMIVKTQTQDGASTRDVFSLSGIAKALKKMKKVCEQ